MRILLACEWVIFQISYLEIELWVTFMWEVFYHSSHVTVSKILYIIQLMYAVLRVVGAGTVTVIMIIIFMSYLSVLPDI